MISDPFALSTRLLAPGREPRPAKARPPPVRLPDSAGPHAIGGAPWNSTIQHISHIPNAKGAPQAGGDRHDAPGKHTRLADKENHCAEGTA